MSTPKKPRREYPEFYPKDRAAWRAWLLEKHQETDGVWVIYDKKESGKERLASCAGGLCIQHAGRRRLFLCCLT